MSGTIRNFGGLIPPTIRDNSLPATPRRIRLRSGIGEILDHWMGKPFRAKVRGEYILVPTGYYVGVNMVLSHSYVLTHTYLWDRVDEPFPINRH